MASPKPKQKPKLKKEGSEKPQSERFKETARELGARTGEAFERVFRAIAPPKQAKKRKAETKTPAK